jgi:hypothetical protein
MPPRPLRFWRARGFVKRRGSFSRREGKPNFQMTQLWSIGSGFFLRRKKLSFELIWPLQAFENVYLALLVYLHLIQSFCDSTSFADVDRKTHAGRFSQGCVWPSSGGEIEFGC